MRMKRGAKGRDVDIKAPLGVFLREDFSILRARNDALLSSGGTTCTSNHPTPPCNLGYTVNSV